MKGVSEGLIIGITVGVVIGVLLALGTLLCLRYRRSQTQIRSSSSRRASTVPIRTNGVNTCAMLSNSTTGQESPRELEDRVSSLWIEGPGRKSMISASGIPKYAYKYVSRILMYSYCLINLLSKWSVLLLGEVGYFILHLNLLNYCWNIWQLFHGTFDNDLMKVVSIRMFDVEKLNGGG